jgi:PAS domain S-box-containing protein
LAYTSVKSQTAPARLRFHVPPKPSHLLRARERIRDYLRQYCTEAQVIDDVVLCIEEAATNAIRHSGSEADIEISLRFTDGNLVAEVKDHGRGFDAAFDRGALPDPLNDHGRGLFLISHLCDQVELRCDGGLEVQMFKTSIALRETVSLESAIADLRAPGDANHRDMRLRALLEEIDEGFFAFDWECRYVHANAIGLRLTGKRLEELLGHTPWELFPQLDGTALQASYRRALELGTPAVLEHRSVVSGDWLEVRIYPTPAGVSAYYREINERKRAELERETANGFLRLINESDSLADLVRAATTFFQQQSGCEAVGIRLREGDDYPYVEARGLPAEFVALENELCARDAAGQICRDSAGYPIMECMCGNVICGRTDPAQEFFSERGSFWTNNTTELLATSSEEDRQARTRNRCNGEGYESVALIALNVGAERLGLLQLNDRRSGRFTPEDIALWERLADQLAVAVSKLRLEGELQESRRGERFLADVIEQAEMPFGVGAPDGRLIFFNQAFADLAGYSREELEERALTWATDLTPQQWRAPEAELLARAVSSRQAVRYEKEYRRKDGSLVPIELLVQPIFDQAGDLLHYRSFLSDISARKQAERALLERETEAARLDEQLPGSRTTRLVDRFRGHRWRVLIGAIAIQSAILAALNTAPDTRHILGLPGSMIALICVVAGALAGPLVGGLVAIAGGGVFYLTVGGRGSHSTVFTIMVSTAIWVTAGLLSGLLARTLSEQAERRRAAAVALVRADAAREAQLAGQARVEELARRLQAQTEDLQAAGEELSAQRDELQERALENARLYEREVEAARLAEVLNEMNGLINSTLDSREIMQTVVEQAVAAVGADSAMVALHHGDDWVAEYGYPEVPGVLHESVRTDEAPFMVMAVSERRPIAIDDCESDARCLPEVQRRFGVRSVLCIPLIVREEVLGVIFFNHHEAAVAFPPTVVEFAGKLAASISTALANARLYEEQRRIATTLQENLLHELPTVAGLELGMVTKTAFEPELVGGDFSDVFVVDDRHVIVLIGDVAGKGVRAAGLTETVRSTVRALAAVDPAPSFILGKASELLLRYDPDEAHVTAFCAVLDPHTGHLSYASAGHPAPVRLGAFSSLPLDVAYGPPLGTFDLPYKESHATLTLEDYLVLYTDGVTEARRGGELFGERRLLEIVAGLRGHSAQEVADGIRDAALDHAGQLRDDLQVVVLRLA